MKATHGCTFANGVLNFFFPSSPSISSTTMTSGRSGQNLWRSEAFWKQTLNPTHHVTLFWDSFSPGRAGDYIVSSISTRQLFSPLIFGGFFSG